MQSFLQLDSKMLRLGDTESKIRTNMEFKVITLLLMHSGKKSNYLQQKERIL